jgi:hypothetical protein
MPNNRFDRGTGISSGSPTRKWSAVSLMGKCQSSSTQAPRTPQSIRRKYTSAERWRAVHMHHAYSTKGPTRDPTLRNCITIFSIPNAYNPLSYNSPLSCLLSILICTSIHPFFISNWPLTYPCHPPLSSSAATITSIGTPRHPYGSTPSYIYVYPSSNIILLFPLDNTTIVATRRDTAASGRHCPGSSGTHLPVALELALRRP